MARRIMHTGRLGGKTTRFRKWKESQTQRLNRAQAEGIAAFYRGEALEKCPYRPGPPTGMAWSWKAGWELARDGLDHEDDDGGRSLYSTHYDGEG